MTITTEQLDEIEHGVRDAESVRESRLPIRCSELLQLISIARAALAWSKTDEGNSDWDRALERLYNTVVGGTP